EAHVAGRDVECAGAIDGRFVTREVQAHANIPRWRVTRIAASFDLDLDSVEHEVRFKQSPFDYADILHDFRIAIFGLEKIGAWVDIELRTGLVFGLQQLTTGTVRRALIKTPDDISAVPGNIRPAFRQGSGWNECYTQGRLEQALALALAL